MPTPYEMYMQSLAGGQNGQAPYGSRDAVMRMPSRPMGGAPFGMSPMGAPGTGGPPMPRPKPEMRSGEAIDSMWGGGDNSDRFMMNPQARAGFDPAQGRVGAAPGGVPGQGPQMPGAGPAMAGGGRNLIMGEDPMLKFGGMAGLIQGLANKGGGAAIGGAGGSGLLSKLFGMG